MRDSQPVTSSMKAFSSVTYASGPLSFASRTLFFARSFDNSVSLCTSSVLCRSTPSAATVPALAFVARLMTRS
eukprot:scaffold45276_cov281-Isochrysis_galbana.AAC.3